MMKKGLTFFSGGLKYSKPYGKIATDLIRLLSAWNRVNFEKKKNRILVFSHENLDFYLIFLIFFLFDVICLKVNKNEKKTKKKIINDDLGRF